MGLVLRRRNGTEKNFFFLLLLLLLRIKPFKVSSHHPTLHCRQNLGSRLADQAHPDDSTGKHVRKRPQKLRSPLLRTQSSKVLPLKAGVSQNIGMHASSTARKFFLKLISTFPVHSSLFCFFKTSSECILCQLWRLQVPVWAPRIKQVTLLIVMED